MCYDINVVTFTQKISFLRRAFGSCGLDRKKQNAILSCPACGQGGSKKKFYINLDTWQCHCWTCGLKGKTILPVLKKYGIKDDIDVFLKYSGCPGHIDDVSIIENEDRIRLPEEFILLADFQNSIDPDVKACISYLKSRGMNKKDLTRAIDKNARRKYINSNNNKKNIVFNEIDIDWSKELVIVEGPFDMFKAGENSTCMLGSSLRDDYLLFSRIVSNQTPIILAMDSDMKIKEQEIAKLLSSYGCSVRMFELGDFFDVGGMTKEEFKNIKKKSIPWNPNQRLKMRIGAIRSGSLL